MKIACLCPTYKRPQFLSNAAACFYAQDYPEDQRKLFIMDDARQHYIQSDDNIELLTESYRYPNLPTKFNILAKQALRWGADVLATWEDDDVYLPHHLSSIAEQVEKGKQFISPKWILSTYAQSMGNAIREQSGGRFHASWAFTKEIFQQIGGWRVTNRLDFDQQFGSNMRSACNPFDYSDIDPPSYIYRWGNGIYHGSQAGEEGFQKFWNDLEKLDSPFVGRLVPGFDDETILLYEKFSAKGEPT